MEWWTSLWVREGGEAYGKAVCFLSNKKWSNRCLLWKTNGTSSSLCAADRFFNLIDTLLNYGITLLGINLGYCLYHDKFALFRRFLKICCPLPSQQELPEFLSCAIKALDEYKEWLPYLLSAGFDPVNLLYRFWINSLGEDALNLILEFTNWKRLPPAVEEDLANYKEKFTWTPRSHFAVIPSLSHLCRLEIRSILGSERLRSDRFIRALPLPVCLQDDLLYLQLLRVSTVPGAEENLRHSEEGAPSAAASTSDHTENRDARNSPARWWHWTRWLQTL